MTPFSLQSPPAIGLEPKYNHCHYQSFLICDHPEKMHSWLQDPKVYCQHHEPLLVQYISPVISHSYFSLGSEDFIVFSAVFSFN